MSFLEPTVQSIENRIKWLQEMVERNSLGEDMKDKEENIPYSKQEYIEHEVWVDNRAVNGDTVGLLCNMYVNVEEGYESKYTKATLRIPKPERKVEITEGELKTILGKLYTHTSSNGEIVIDGDNLIEEIFGRD